MAHEFFRCCRRNTDGWPFPSNAIRALLSAVALAVAAPSQQALSQEPARPLALNDISILFPPPAKTADLTNLIRLSDLVSPQGARLWSNEDFQQFLVIAESAGGVSGSVSGSQFRLGLPAEVKSIDKWFISGIRIDPGAPGLSPKIIEQFGQQPQIRFIVQPVSQRAGGRVHVHDIAGHLIFAFMSGADGAAQDGCFPRPKPDMPTFKKVVGDFAGLRDRLAAGQFGGMKISTAGPLNVHPGFTGAAAKPFRDALKSVLEKHIVPQRLTAMAIMGLDGPEPWIFVAMQKNLRLSPPPVGSVPSPALDGKQVAQMLNFRSITPEVVPEPATNNLNPITCRHMALPDPARPTDKKGVSTAELFKSNVPDARLMEIVDTIADPAKSHFFNTDCVSCHTDTRRLLNRFSDRKIDNIAPAVLPKDDWNVRNFGWFTLAFRTDPAVATVTRRTATETVEVLEFLNKEVVGK